MRASDVMTRSVVTINQRASTAEAVELMVARAVSGLPVLDDHGGLVGILTAGDLVRRARLSDELRIGWWKKALFGPWHIAREYVRCHNRSVGSVMTREILCIEEDTPLARVAATFEEGQVKRLPVVKEGKVVGIVSRSDLQWQLPGSPL